MIADLLTDFPERFEGLEVVAAIMADASKRELKIEDHWPQGGRMVLKFAGVDSIESADELRDAEICVNESEAVRLAADEFYDWQLEGCEVRTSGGTYIGKVRELMRTGGTEILVINGEREYLVPFATSICTEVDIENKMIVIDPPEGLLEF